MRNSENIEKILEEVRQCTTCADVLPLGPRPVVTASPSSRILIIGQAPGTRVHETGIPWNDRSGNQLRDWIGIDTKLFYDTRFFAIMPMGFCYPGKGKSGDLPPRKECAPLWHARLLQQMPNLELTLLIGQYAQRYYLRERAGRNLTETVHNYATYLPHFLPLPHPSPRNGIWLRKNPWFEKEVVPYLRQTVQKLTGGHP